MVVVVVVVVVMRGQELLCFLLLPFHRENLRCMSTTSIYRIIIKPLDYVDMNVAMVTIFCIVVVLVVVVCCFFVTHMAEARIERSFARKGHGIRHGRQDKRENRGATTANSVGRRQLFSCGAPAYAERYTAKFRSSELYYELIASLRDSALGGIDGGDVLERLHELYDELALEKESEPFAHNVLRVAWVSSDNAYYSLGKGEVLGSRQVNARLSVISHEELEGKWRNLIESEMEVDSSSQLTASQFREFYFDAKTVKKQKITESLRRIISGRTIFNVKKPFLGWLLSWRTADVFTWQQGNQGEDRLFRPVENEYDLVIYIGPERHGQNLASALPAVTTQSRNQTRLFLSHEPWQSSLDRRTSSSNSGSRIDFKDWPLDLSPVIVENYAVPPDVLMNTRPGVDTVLLPQTYDVQQIRRLLDARWQQSQTRPQSPHSLDRVLLYEKSHRGTPLDASSSLLVLSAKLQGLGFKCAISGSLSRDVLTRKGELFAELLDAGEDSTMDFQVRLANYPFVVMEKDVRPSAGQLIADAAIAGGLVIAEGLRLNQRLLMHPALHLPMDSHGGEEQWDDKSDAEKIVETLLELRNNATFFREAREYTERNLRFVDSRQAPSPEQFVDRHNLVLAKSCLTGSVPLITPP